MGHTSEQMTKRHEGVRDEGKITATRSLVINA
jgi:hypothetical protein